MGVVRSELKPLDTHEMCGVPLVITCKSLHVRVYYFLPCLVKHANETHNQWATEDPLNRDQDGGS